MGALLSLPLMAVPSVGTVCYRPFPIVPTLLTPPVSISSSQLELPAAEQQLVQHSAAHVGNFRAGRSFAFSLP